MPHHTADLLSRTPNCLNKNGCKRGDPYPPRKAHRKQPFLRSSTYTGLKMSDETELIFNGYELQYPTVEPVCFEISADHTSRHERRFQIVQMLVDDLDLGFVELVSVRFDDLAAVTNDYPIVAYDKVTDDEHPMSAKLLLDYRYLKDVALQSRHRSNPNQPQDFISTGDVRFILGLLPQLCFVLSMLKSVRQGRSRISVYHRLVSEGTQYVLAHL